MADLLQLSSNMHIFDAGCGIGGPSRHLAQDYGCRVTGVDITGNYIEAANTLASRFGLSRKLSYQQGDILDLPYPDDCFDIVWTQHVSMNILDKNKLYNELFRVLRKGGKLACYDVTAGSQQSIHFPVPWARIPDVSFLASVTQQKIAIQQAEFEILHCIDKSTDALEWLKRRQEKRTCNGDPVLSYRLLLGEQFDDMMTNQVINFSSGLTKAIMIIAQKN